MLSYKIISYSFLFSGAFILTAVLTAVLRKFSLKRGLFTRKKETPYIGGVSFCLGLILCAALFCIFFNKTAPSFQFVWIMIFSALLLAIEFIDDLKDFSLKSKVIAQVFFIFLFLLFAKKIQIYFLPFWANYFISFLWIMGVVNAFNHLDVADGFCGGVSFIVSVIFFVVFLKTASSLAFVFAALSGALLAFMFFNLPKAKVLMGNSGSHFLGFLFAALSIHGDYASLNNKTALFLPVLILGLPIIDTFYLIAARGIKRISPLRKSGDHLILKYLLKGYSHEKVLIAVCFLAAAWGVSGIFSLQGLTPKFLISLGAALIGTALFIIGANIGVVSRGKA